MSDVRFTHQAAAHVQQLLRSELLCRPNFDETMLFDNPEKARTHRLTDSACSHDIARVRRVLRYLCLAMVSVVVLFITLQAHTPFFKQAQLRNQLKETFRNISLIMVRALTRLSGFCGFRGGCAFRCFSLPLGLVGLSQLFTPLSLFFQDCITCEKCKVFGKLQTLGMGTALKILLEPHSRERVELERNEIIVRRILILSGVYRVFVPFFSLPVLILTGFLCSGSHLHAASILQLDTSHTGPAGPGSRSTHFRRMIHDRNH